MKKKLIAATTILTLSAIALTGFDKKETLKDQPTYQTITVWQGDNVLHENSGDLSLDIKPEYITITDNETGTLRVIDADDITLIERADVVEYK